MRVALGSAALLLLVPLAAPAAPTPAEPVSVLIVGTFHMSNPGQDLHNLAADDVLAPKRQAEIAAVVDGLKRFRPTRVAVEWPAALANERYAAYRNGTLAASRNEVVQLGFRLAQLSALETVDGIDVAGDFPYDAVADYARKHGQAGILEAAAAEVQASVDATSRLLAAGSVGGVLRFLNDPEHVRSDHAFYRAMLRVGGRDAQPGAELLSAWYRRNFLICANLIQSTHAADRVVVFYGAGHGFLLRQCVAETPGLRLVEAGDYLPQ